MGSASGRNKSECKEGRTISSLIAFWYTFLFTAPSYIQGTEDLPWKTYQERLYSVLQSTIDQGCKEGDFIELGQLGAYGMTFRTKFNGFYSDEIYQVNDDSIISMYDKDYDKKYLVA